MTRANAACVWLLLSAASLGQAQDQPLAEVLAARLGRAVLGSRAVAGEVPAPASLATSIGDPLDPAPERPQARPERAYRGQRVDLEGLTVQRLTFRDPAAALEFAERHVQPPAVVDVRGKYVVAIEGRSALDPGVASAALQGAWQGAPARTPRTLLAVAEDSGNLASLAAARGELRRQTEGAIRSAAQRFPQAPVGVPQRVSDTLRVTWTDPGRRAVRVEGSVTAECDLRGPLARAVVGKDPQAHARLGRLLDEVARSSPVRAEGQPEEQAARQAPAGVGMKRLLDGMGEALGEGEVTAPIR